MNDNYHTDYSRISKTMLNVFYDSPVEYRETYITQRRPLKISTRAMDVGSICHAVLLEQKSIHDVVATYPESCLKSDGSINSKPARQFEADNPDKYVVKQRVFDECLEICDALEDTDLAIAIAQASSCERRHDATVHGVICRCKPDIVCELDDKVVIYDLKFQPKVSQQYFERSARNFRYWLQDAHYTQVCRFIYSKPVQFRFFVVETVYPYRVQAYWYDERSREIARGSHKTKLLELDECIKTGLFEDRWQSEITLNSWDVDEDDQLVEFGEVEE